MAIISGRREDAGARVARALLCAGSLGYRLGVGIRNNLYNHHVLRAHRAGAPVLCIGNLTTGGTGKTPLVIWLCRRMREKGLACAILTRGYRTQKGELSDEPALLAAQCPDVPVVVNPDRVAGATNAIQNHGAQVLVMDDGFQHRRLARDLDIIAIDATNPFGYDRVLPAGLLREPLTGLKRAHAVVLTRCDQVAEEALSRIEEEIRRVNRNLVVARSVHAPVAVRTAAGAEVPLNQLRGKRVFTFCGIGNPRAFSRTVSQLGATLVGTKAFDDHYRYTPQDLKAVRDQAQSLDAALVLTTQKDWTKIEPAELPQQGPPLACLAIDLQITAGEELLTALIARVLGGRIPRPE
ncbi:MAG TPA: tetraacyldisaccharide 4'-kinase [Sedimentisphaerales bacterium]|nr:tetraacyldisaccharide 4'-kinase [Sedimentisphaerales bacterium]